MSICRTSDERAYLSGAMSETGMRLAQESILMQYGYNISQIEDLSSLRKKKILALLVDNNILTSSDVISYLDFFISQRKHQSRCDILPPLSYRLKWGLLVRLPDRAKHKRAIPVCLTVLLDIMIVRNFFRKDQEIFFSVSKYSLQGTTQSRYLTGGVPPVRFSMWYSSCRLWRLWW